MIFSSLMFSEFNSFILDMSSNDIQIAEKLMIQQEETAQESGSTCERRWPVF